jgi:hypothetical protein
LAEEVIEDSSVFWSEELLEPAHRCDFLIDDDTP